jgi:hypothetical protein
MLKTIEIYRRVYELNYDGDNSANDNSICMWVINNQSVHIGDVIQIDNDRRYMVTKDGTLRID